ncbi:fungal-specific transcription factor domain-containing protein [Leptodontidium sp. MPI-SDFR-AT-0119]|nr:fungal-specific transcription factor domain-containing protein [Leptodontidium sp. MPI-SDFR-AT-0119]
MSAPPSDYGHICPICDDSFTRQDHLKRHLHTHEPSKYFTCKYCGKPFGRRDSLIRHERGHEESASAEGHKTIFTRVSLACMNCSKSKVRCDGESPCNHCSSRQLECHRGANRRKKQRKNPRASTDDQSTTTCHQQQGSLEAQMHSLPRTPISEDHVTHDASTVSTSRDKPSQVVDGPISQSSYDPNLPTSLPVSTAFEFAGPQDWDFQFDIADWMNWQPDDFQLPPDMYLPQSLELGSLELTVAIQDPLHDRRAPGVAQNATSIFSPEARSTSSSMASPGYFQITANEVLNSHSACSVDHDAEAGINPKPSLLGERKSFVSFPDLGAADIDILDAENYGHTPPLPAPVYKTLLKGVKEICILQNLSDGLKLSLFPSQAALESFIQLYFEYFQGLFPIFHQPTFNPAECHWIEILALATIGCQYSKSTAAQRCAPPLSEIFRLSIFHTLEIDRLSVRSLWLTRVMVLDVVGTVYSGDRRLLEVGLTILNAVTMQCRRNGYLKGAIPESVPGEKMNDIETNKLWTAWIREETCRRIGYSVWILQCQLSLNFDLPSNMKIDELVKPLPCPEDLWEAPNAITWSSLYDVHRVESSAKDSNLGSTLSDVMRENSVPTYVGGFGRLALVHTIYQTTYHLRSSFSNPLIVGLTGRPLDEGTVLKNWQSRAVKLLEVLTPSKSSSVGDFTSLHYNPSWTLQSNFITTVHHVSLLNVTPIGDLFMFVSPNAGSTDKSRTKQNLVAWVSHDEGRDARRAVLCACVIFTTVRVRSSHSFHESVPFLMATLTIWVYNQLAHLVFDDLSGSAVDLPVTLRLDQILTADGGRLWIDGKPGAVRGHLAEIGDVHHQGAGKRLLTVAHQSLVAKQSWGLSYGFAKFLKTLLDLNHY